MALHSRRCALVILSTCQTQLASRAPNTQGLFKGSERWWQPQPVCVCVCWMARCWDVLQALCCSLCNAVWRGHESCRNFVSVCGCRQVSSDSLSKGHFKDESVLQQSANKRREQAVIASFHQQTWRLELKAAVHPLESKQTDGREKLQQLRFL